MSEEIVKVCTKCHQPKTLDKFYKGEGSYGRAQPCKECKNAAGKKWDKEHPEVRARIRRKHQDSEKSRKYQKEWTIANREKVRSYGRKSYRKHSETRRAHTKRFLKNNPGYQREWVKKNKPRMRSYLQKWQSENYEKHLAHVAVKNAVKAGKLQRVKNLKCSECGKPAVNYHHHRGYTKEHQLDVIPVCATCHKRLDNATS